MEVRLEQFFPSRAPSVDPKKFPDETFELFSIPAHDRGAPEVVRGAEIGSTKKVVEPGDVLISRIVPHIRRVCIVPARSGEMRQIASGEWIIVRAREHCGEYIRHFLLSDEFHHQFMSTVAGIGGSLLRARPKEVGLIPIELPPLDEQKRIAAILDKADSLRQARRRVIARFDGLAQAIFYEMFGDPATNPRGWPTKSMSDLAGGFRNGLSPSRAGAHECEVLTLSAVTSARLDPKSRKVGAFNGQPKAQYFPSNTDFLICRGNGNKSLVGRGQWATPDVAGVVFPDTIIAATFPTEAIGRSYLEWVWNTRHIRDQIESVARTTNGTYKVNQEGLGSIDVPEPPGDLQREADHWGRELETLRSRLAIQEIRLGDLFASLQQRAFRGEL